MDSRTASGGSGSNARLAARIGPLRTGIENHEAVTLDFGIRCEGQGFLTAQFYFEAVRFHVSDTSYFRNRDRNVDLDRQYFQPVSDRSNSGNLRSTVEIFRTIGRVGISARNRLQGTVEAIALEVVTANGVTAVIKPIGIMIMMD